MAVAPYPTTRRPASSSYRRTAVPGSLGLRDEGYSRKLAMQQDQRRLSKDKPAVTTLNVVSTVSERQQSLSPKPGFKAVRIQIMMAFRFPTSLVLILLISFPQCGDAHPNLHVQSCSGPPDQSKYPRMPHPAVVQGQQGALASFEIQNSAGELVTEYEPGKVLIFIMTLDIASEALAIASAGQLLDSQGKAATACDGKRLPMGTTGYYPSGASARHAFAWRPDPDFVDDVEVTFQWATGSSSPIQVASINVTTSAAVQQVPVLPPPAETIQDSSAASPFCVVSLQRLLLAFLSATLSAVMFL